MRTTPIILVVLSASILAGCATRGSNYTPLVDMRGRSQAQFQADLGDCRAYAEQRPGAGVGAVVGALAGALLGAAIAPRGIRNEVAGYGAAAGGSGTAIEAQRTQERIIMRCLAGRGYVVLD